MKDHVKSKNFSESKLLHEKVTSQNNKYQLPSCTEKACPKGRSR